MPLTGGLVGNFGVTEVLVVLGIMVVLFGAPRRRKVKRRAAAHLRQTKDAIGSAKVDFLSGFRDDGSRVQDSPVAVSASGGRQSSLWRRLFRR
jgi:Sec-independent protein translocase protein TatA